MTRWSPSRLLLTIAAGAAAWAVLAALCILVGSTGSIGLPTADQLPWRLEAVLQASLIGAALSAAGVVFQAILRNPLADPYLLGVSSGASLFAYLWQFRFVATLATLAGAAITQQAFAFAGAMISVGIVFLLASRAGRLEPITLLLVGVIVNAVNASLFLLFNALHKDLPASGGAFTFLVGGIQTNLTRQQMLAATLVIAAGWIVLMFLSGQLALATLGESEAEALGIRVNRLRWVSLIIASLITASAVALSGPIGFVGLVCPHLGRLIVGGDTRKLLPIATGIGAGLLAVADAASRYLAGGGGIATLLPVGVLTGLLGGPFFLMLLWQSRKILGADAGSGGAS